MSGTLMKTEVQKFATEYFCATLETVILSATRTPAILTEGNAAFSLQRCLQERGNVSRYT
jgi:hypothetical protein